MVTGGKRTDIGADAGSVDTALVARRSARWILLGIVVLGAALRFYRLGFQSYWVDELLTIGAAEVDGTFGLRAFFENVQGPFHALIVHLVSRVSASESALRSISALAGVAAIPVCYLLAKDLLDRRSALITALLVAVSPFAVWYSQEVRNYSLLILLSTAATLFVVRAVAGRRATWVWYVVSVVLAVYCNLSALFLVAAHALFAAWRLSGERRRMAGAAIAFVMVAALASPFAWSVAGWAQREDVAEMVRFAPGSEAGELRRGETTFSPMAFPYALFAMGYGHSLGPGLRELHEAPPVQGLLRHAPVVISAGVVFGLALVFGLRRLARDRRALGLVLLVVSTPAVASAALALANVKPINARYLAVAFPIVCVMAAAGVTSLRRARGALLCGALVVFCGVSLWGYYVSPSYWKADVRAAARHIESREREGDVVLVPVVRDVFNFYYRGEARRFVIFRGQAGSRDEIARRIADGAAGADRLWFVEARLWFVDPERVIPSYLDESYERLDAAAFPGVSVALYELRSGAEGVDGGVAIDGHSARLTETQAGS